MCCGMFCVDGKFVFVYSNQEYKTVPRPSTLIYYPQRAKHKATSVIECVNPQFPPVTEKSVQGLKTFSSLPEVSTGTVVL